MTNSADPDQLASSEANWSGFTLFVKAGYISRTRVNADNFVDQTVWMHRLIQVFVECMSGILLVFTHYSNIMMYDIRAVAF